VKVEVGLKFEMTFLTQHLGLSTFYPHLGSNNPALFRVQLFHYTLKNVGLFQPKCGSWTNPNVGLKMQLKKCKVESES